MQANCDIFENEIAGLKSEIAQLHATFNEAITDVARENADLLHRAEQAETELAAIPTEPLRDAAVFNDHVTAPLSVLRLAAAQFNALAREFQKSGNLVSQVMCEASASTLNCIVEIDRPPAARRMKAPPLESNVVKNSRKKAREPEKADCYQALLSRASKNLTTRSMASAAIGSVPGKSKPCGLPG